MTMSSLNILIDSTSLQRRIIGLMEEYMVQHYRSSILDFDSNFMTDTITDTTYIPTTNVTTNTEKNKIVIVYVNPQSRKFAEDFHAYLQQRQFTTEPDFLEHQADTTEGTFFYISDCDRSKIQGTNVILLHNIVENEQSIAEYEDTIMLSAPNSICSMTLLCPYNINCNADFIGFTIPIARIVGYGLSWKGHFQQLYHISTIS